MKKTIIPTLFFAAIIASCTKTQFDEFEPVASGNANFTRFISVGNSLTQGHQDNGVHNEHQQQENSYPAIIAKQMNTSFKQPLVQGNGSGYKSLQDLTPTVIDISPSSSWSTSGGDASWSVSTSYNNLGISGIRLTDCVPTSGNPTSSTINQFITSNNPFGGFLDFGSLVSPISYLEHVKNSNATFFTNWLGNNDVLGWATSGGDDGSITIPLIGSVGISELTPINVFRNKYDSIMDAFTANGAKGICATIPDVTAIPFFTTVTLEAIGKDVWITEGPYSNNPGNVRKATSADLILLTTKDALVSPAGHGFVQTDPLTHTEVLDKDEVLYVQNHTNMINSEIKASATAHGAAVVDMHKHMYDLKDGMIFDGVEMNAKYIEGGAFSLDGVHPNTRGYAIIANLFIEEINRAYGSNLRPVPVQNYKGIIFP